MHYIDLSWACQYIYSLLCTLLMCYILISLTCMFNVSYRYGIYKLVKNRMEAAKWDQFEISKMISELAALEENGMK